MSSIRDLVQEMADDLIPRASKSSYEKEWSKLNKFLDKFECSGVYTQDTLQAYFVHLSRQGYAPTTIRSSVSMIKKMCLARFKKVDDDVWDGLNSWLNNVSKDYVPAEVSYFTRAARQVLRESWR